MGLVTNPNHIPESGLVIGLDKMSEEQKDWSHVVPSFLPDFVKARLDVCDTCEKYNKKMYMCNECKCVMPIKSFCKWCSCPDGRWPSLEAKPEPQS